MFDKRRGFFQRLAQRLDKIDKNEFVEVLSLLLEERALWTALADFNPLKITVLRSGEVIYDSSGGLYARLSARFGSEATQTFEHPDSKNKTLTIKKVDFERYSFFYIYDAALEKSAEENIRSGLEALEMLAAGISHEIKNPLTAVDLHTQLIERGIKSGKIKASGEIKDYISLVKTENARLLSVLETFIGAARKRRPVFAFCEVEDAVRAIARLFEPELELKNISLALELRPVSKIFSSLEIIQQILADIFRNAIEAVGNSSIKKLCITLNESPQKDGLYITIEDSGTGIPLAFKKRIFEPYFTTKKTGTGLGLTLVKKMVEELGGEITVEDSTALGGAAFKIFLPISQEQKKLEFFV